MVLTFALLIMISPMGICEDADDRLLMEALDLDSAQEIGKNVGLDVEQFMLDLLSGGEVSDAIDSKTMKGALKEHLFKDIRRTVGRLAVPICMSMLLRMILDQSRTEKGVFGLICRLCCASALCTTLAETVTVASALMRTVIRCTEAMTPVVISAFTLSGLETTAASFASVSAISTNLVQEWLGKWGIGLSVVSIGIAIAGNLSAKFKLKRLHGAIKDVFQWGVGIVMAGFMGALTVQGRISTVRDSAGLRTAKFAIESVIPIIGGDVSDSLGSLLSTAMLLRNAVGASGLMLILISTLMPLARIAGVVISLKLISALCEPLGDDIQAAMLAQSAESCEMILVTCAAICLLCALLMGSCITAAGSVVR